MKCKSEQGYKANFYQNKKNLIIFVVIFSMLFSLSACGKKESSEDKSITTINNSVSDEMLLANSTTSLAVDQYIYARLKTEDFIVEDLSQMPKEELEVFINELVEIWDTSLFVFNEWELIMDDVISLLEKSEGDKTTYNNKTKNVFEIVKITSPFDSRVYAAKDEKIFDSKTWAENFTKKYDDIKGGQAIKQLAKQLNTDAKEVYKQLLLAQEIVSSDAIADAAFYDKLMKIAQATKSASKVGLFVTGAIVTGGGSLSALGTSSVGLGQAGALILDGVDCLVDVAATSSNIILGEKNKVTLKFEDLKGKLAPVTSVIGLQGLDVKDTLGTAVYIGDSLVDWFYENKILGVKIKLDNNKSEVIVKPMDIAEKSETEIKEIITKEGFDLKEENSSLADPVVQREELAKNYELDKKTIMDLLENLKGQLKVIAQVTGEVVENTPTSKWEEQLENINIKTLSGTYDTRISSTRLDVFYLMDGDEEEGEILEIRPASPDDLDLDEEIQITLDLLQEGEKLIMLDEDGEAIMVLVYAQESGKWISVEDHPLGTTTIEAEISASDDQINVTILMTESFEKSSIPNGINQDVFKMTKSKQ